ncbi:sulfatase [Haladaptatus sp. DFWS20]|uniref:sulfatase n=1 Tax=Haladaptatus sp. DFWS20 TaxID=3403467 RepID=UPI003EB8FFE2
MSKNVVLVVMDTARASDTRYIREELSGSSLEKLASEGTDFTHAYSNASWTLPSHTSLFTGTYTSKHGTHAGHKSYDGQFATLAEVFSEKGYQTVGITNNAWVTDEFGLSRGFDQFYKVWQYIQTDTDLGEVKLTSHGTDQMKKGIAAFLNGNILANLVNTVYGQFFYRRSDYGAKRTNSIVREWISERDDENPFFLFINYLEPHLDYQPPKELAEKFLPKHASYEDAIAIPQKPWEYVSGNLEMSDNDFELLQGLYRAEIAYLDQQIGELRTIFEDYNEWEDTIFVVVGDHGENIGDHGLMDHQYSLHDTLLHVPLIIQGGSFNRGGKSDSLVQTLDLFPSLLDAINARIPSYSQGVSIHPNRATPTRRHVFAEYLCPQPAIDRLSEKTDTPRKNLERLDKKLRAVRTKEHKLVRDSDHNNISVSDPTITGKLDSELDAWLESFDQASTDESIEMSESTKQKLEDLGYLQ